jgi:putative transposase
LTDRTELATTTVVAWLGVQRGTFYEWKQRYGKANEHNAWVPRDHWITPQERAAIIDFHSKNPYNGYRRLTYMMMDQDVVCASPATVHRVLRKAGVLDRWSRKPSRRGKGFVQPLRAHEHWHIDISYINVAGTFFHLCSILDGASRFIVHWELRASMTEREVEGIVQVASEKFPEATPRIISDNGPQFVANEFKNLLRHLGMTHVRTSPYYPQSNGKLERWHHSLKSEGIRPFDASTPEEARALVERYVAFYNHERLHSAIGFITPADWLAGRAEAIHRARDQKLEAAREARKLRRAAEHGEVAA